MKTSSFRLAAWLSLVLMVMGLAQPSFPALADSTGGLRQMLGLEQPEPHFLRAEQAFGVDVRRLPDGGAVARWTIAPGYYLYREQLQIHLDGRDLIGAGQVDIPAGKAKQDENFGATTVYFDSLVVTLRPPLEGNQLMLRYQGCATGGVCYPPMVQTFALDDLPVAEPATRESVPVSPPSKPLGDTVREWGSDPEQLAHLLEIGGWWTNLITFYGLGLLLAFTPCNLPMIPIVSALVAGQPGKRSPYRAFLLSLIYVLSVSVTYAAAGVLTALLGANLQASFQNPVVLWGFAGLFGLLGLAMFGLYELQMPSFIQSRIDMWVRRVRGGTLLGTVAMGLLSALIIGPCVAAPLVGALIYIGQSGDLWLGGTILFVLSLGMGTPLLLVGTSAGVLVPRAGAWMVYVQHLFGLMLLAVALWIINRLVTPQVALVLWGVWLIVVGVWLGALNPAQTPARRVGQGLALAVVIYGALVVTGGVSGGDRFWLPLDHLRGAATTPAMHVPFKRIKTVADLQRELDGASARNQPVMLDFYADWCVDCVIMAQTTFSDSRVVQALGAVLILQADVTANDAEDRELMRHLEVIGPPTLVFFGPDGRERRSERVVGLLQPEAFLNHLNRVEGMSGETP